METDRKLNADYISELIKNVQLVDEHVVLFKSIESRTLTYGNNFSNLFLESIANNLLFKHKKCSQSELTVLFLEKIKVSEETIGIVEKSTRAESNEKLWFELRSGRLTTSKHHEIFIKTNSLIRATGLIKPKTTALPSKIIFSDVKLENPPSKWGIGNEENAFKSFYTNEIVGNQIVGISKIQQMTTKNCCAESFSL